MTSTTLPSHLDRVLYMIGCPGKYHLLVAFLLCCMQFPVSFSDYLLRFYQHTPLHRCKVKSNLTLGDYELRPLVTQNGRRRYSSCALYKDPLDHSKGIKDCSDGFEFLLQQGEWTVVSEWDLVCKRESLAALLPYVTTTTAMVGALLMGILADRYGRKYVLLASLSMHTTLGIILHFIPVYGLFATVFSLQGLLITGVQCTAYLLLVENLPTTWHWRAAFAVSVFHSCGQLMLSVLAWLVRNWRYVQLVISAPGVVVIGYFWLLPRSLAWLVSEDRSESAYAQLERLSSFTGLIFVPSLRIQLLKSCRVSGAKNGSNSTRHGFETIVCSSRLRILALIQYFTWFVLSMVSKCSVEEIPALRNNPYSRLFVQGILELCFVVLLYFFVNRLGLKLTQGTAMAICGILCVFSAIVDKQVEQIRIKAAADRGLHQLPPTLAFLAKCIAGSLSICTMLHAAKTFPTGVRALGFGTCLFCGKIAHLFAPLVDDLPEESRYGILSLCGILSLVGGILSTWLLPECSNRPLATIAEEIEIGRTKTIDDTDLEFQEFTGSQEFVPNIPVLVTEDGASYTSSSISRETEISEVGKKSIVTRLATIIQKKSVSILRKKKSASKADAPSTDLAIVANKVFEPVTGFVFTWDQGEQSLKLADFEKELSNFWKLKYTKNEEDESGDTNVELNNELNLVYHFQKQKAGDLKDTSL